MQPGDFVVPPQPRHRPLLEARKIWRFSGETRVLAWWCNTPTAPCRGGARPARAASAHRASSDAPPDLNRYWRGGLEAAATGTGPSRTVRQVWALDSRQALCERHQAPGFAFPADGPWQLEAGGFLPLRSPPQPPKAISEVKREHGEAPAMDRLVCAMWASAKPKLAIPGPVQGGDKAGKQPPCFAPTHACWPSSTGRTLSERFAPSQSTWPWRTASAPAR